MDDERERFELEEGEPPPPRPASVPFPEGDGEPAAAPSPRAPERPGEPAVDERTVAERTGTAVPRVAGVRPPPAGWPLEALLFPLRRPELLLGAVLALLLLDLVSVWNVFVGWLWKIAALPFVLRWQFHVAGMSAAGHDAPASYDRAIDIDREGFRRVRNFVFLAVCLAVPGILGFATGHWLLGAVLLSAASVWMSSAALGESLGDPSLKYPSAVGRWFGKRPLALIAGTAGWWGLVAVEILCIRLKSTSLVTTIVLLALARAASVWLLLVSARALGVVGRSWEPSEGADSPDAPGAP